jgi:hypothetical protein
MKKSIAYWQTAGFIFTAMVGTLLHFLYDWTGGKIAAALFSALNESIWEHLKLLFYPMVIFTIIEYFFWGKEVSNFWCVKVAGSLLGLVLIPVLYYTYTGALGIEADWFNITIFFLVAGAVFWLETKLFQKKFCRGGIWWPVLALLAVAFIVLTFVPPRIPLFRDPVSGTYGVWLEEK